MNWRGPWAAGTAYAIDDGVSQGGSSYIAVAANTGSQPPSANWNLIAQQGAAGATGPQGAGANPQEVGTIKYWPVATPPQYWLNCDGSAVSRTGQAALYALIGTTYGPGDGSTTFNLPDLRGRVGLGVGQGSGLTNRLLAAIGGEENHVLSVAELAAHTHTITVTVAPHTHSMGNVASFTAGSGYGVGTNTAPSGYTTYATTATATATAANTGSGTGHNTMPPFLVINFIIKVTQEVPLNNPVAPIADTTTSGLVNKLSGNATDYIGGDNACHDIVAAVQPTIWSARLRSFNAIGNPTFEVDQRNVGNTVAGISGGIMIQDRWQGYKAPAATLVASMGQNSVPAGINLPGTSFAITRSFIRITLTTAQATLAASDFLLIQQFIEGPKWRELQNDVHSFQILVRSSVPNLIFSAGFRDYPTVTQCLFNPFTLGAANTWALLPLANLPIFPAGNFVNTPGNIGYSLLITLASGSGNITPANGTWQSGSFLAAIGQSNFAASPVGSTFDIAFVQHEPGPLCTTPIDCPFTQNYDGCLRYFQKSAVYGTKPGTDSPATVIGMAATIGTANTAVRGALRFIKSMAKAPTFTLTYNNVINSAFVEGIGVCAFTTGYLVSDSALMAATFAASQTVPTTATGAVFGGWGADTNL
jgi:microcystin-dependent protein